jgi:Flp pilus assembly protein TadG
MKRGPRLVRSEKGQSVVIVAAALVGLLALTGLAIDGGNLFWQRRRAQNAADAGAMAGTRILAQIIATCQDGDSSRDAQVAQAVTEFVGINGFSTSNGSTISAWYVNKNSERLGSVGDLGSSTGGEIPISTTGVEVQVNADIDTYFLKVVGIDGAPVSAAATAMTGKIIQLTGGIMPFAVPDEALGMEGDDFVVFEDNHETGGMFCENKTNCIGDPASDDSHRGWLNLNYIYNKDHLSQTDAFYRTWEQNVPNRGCGPYPERSIDDGIVGWAGDGCPYPFPIFAGAAGQTSGDFIHGSPGARQSSLSEIVQTWNGSTVYAPVFDFVYTSDYMEANFPPAEGIGWPIAGGGGSAFLYHVIGFVAITVDDNNPHDHRLQGHFGTVTTGEGVISTDLGFDPDNCTPTSLTGINLWK